MRPRPEGLARGVPALALLWGLLFAGYGCPWFTNMADQQSVRPLEEAPRPAVPGTIPVGYPTPPAITFDEANKLANPTPPTDASLARGQQLFETFCLVCHGPHGHGDGPVAPKFIRPPDLHGASKGYSDGYIYALIVNGRGNMPSYNRIAPDERWDLINYLRKLQSQP
jgi:mono/diheme cytochrome c family protein